MLDESANLSGFPTKIADSVWYLDAIPSTTGIDLDFHNVHSIHSHEKILTFGSTHEREKENKETQATTTRKPI